ncbi:carboxylate--amine ligase [Natronorarus salvus]|uniref:carboxylate--amine ligase n=1 Tax=Natronorarus salvus TaxID=3117733 RepID=UPI002F25F8B5
MTETRVLVLDGRTLSSLSVTRSLGEGGYSIHLGESFRWNLTRFSKHVDGTISYPSPDEKPAGFVDALLRKLRRTDYDVVIPTRDATTRLLATHRDRFDPLTSLYLADAKKIERFADKGETIRLAQNAGTPVPRTYFPEDTPLETIAEEVSYPALVRARRASGSRGIVRVESADEMQRAYTEVERDYGVPIIQEYVSHEGGHFSIGTLFDENSEPVAVHVYEETKQYPVSGGPAVEAKSVPVEPWVDGMLGILREVNWVGPAHMDVLYDPDDATYKLLEVNPRFWMSVGLTIRSGVDIPGLLVRLAMDEEIPDRVIDYDTDLLYRWILPSGLFWASQQERLICGIHQLTSQLENQICYGVFSSKDLGPTVGVLFQSATFILEEEKRRQVFNRGL